MKFDENYILLEKKVYNKPIQYKSFKTQPNFKRNEKRSANP